MAKNYKIPSITDLIESRVHIGHQVKRWHPNMFEYIYTNKQGVHIFDLEKTVAKLEEACDALFELAKTGKKIVFVGTKRQAKDILALEAQRCGALYVTERWLGGTITNFPMLRKSIKKLLELKEKREKGDFAMYTKKERLLLDRDIEKLEKYFGGLTSLTGNPDALVLIDARKEKTALKEGNNIGIPVFALIDTNTDPKLVKYPVPGNDDAMRSIGIILKAFADAIEAGYKEFAKQAEDKLAKDAKIKADIEAEEVKVQEELDLAKLTVTTAQAVHITKEETKDEELAKDL